MLLYANTKFAFAFVYVHIGKKDSLDFLDSLCFLLILVIIYVSFSHFLVAIQFS